MSLLMKWSIQATWVVTEENVNSKISAAQITLFRDTIHDSHWTRKQSSQVKWTTGHAGRTCKSSYLLRFPSFILREVNQWCSYNIILRHHSWLTFDKEMKQLSKMNNKLVRSNRVVIYLFHFFYLRPKPICIKNHKKLYKIASSPFRDLKEV